MGDTLHGFTVERVEEVAELEGVAYIMRHAQSGARLMYLACDDENKAFAITFKTPPADSTGVFHILEHSVLCGSEKFPVKEPFVNLLKSSMQTFLNALTFPDKTMYPVASTNEQDLLNLMDVYLDAVLNPGIYHKREMFAQEGWHYEMASPDDELRLNGVVFNEMKGALSDPEAVLYNALCSALFPDTAYAFESGGDPAVIPSLSYEEYLATHARHYRPDNSYIFLYGDIGLDRELELLDERYLAAAKEQAAGPNPLDVQAPTVAMDVTKTMQTAPENACLGVAWVSGTAHDRERNFALDILMDALMGSNEAPLKRALLDGQFADDVNGFLVAEQLQPMVIIQAMGVKPDSRPAFLAIIDDTVRRLVSDGIPEERLAASLSRAEFAVRERDFGMADGVVLAMQAMAGWLYDDSLATAYLHYEDAFASMRENIGSGYFEQLLKVALLEAGHKACAEVVPVEEPGEGKEEERLEALKQAMDAAEIGQVIDEAATLHRLQEEPDGPEALATLPMLALDDILGMRPYPAYRLVDTTPLPCLYHDIPTRHIDYVYHYFGLERLEAAELPYVGVLMRLLGKLDTATHSASDLDNLTHARLGSIRFFVESYGDETDPTLNAPKFVVGASALSENIAYLAALPQEIWSSTLFEDAAKIKDILQQNRIAMEQDFVNAGQSAALARTASYYSPSAAIREQVAGIDFYLFLKDLLAHYEERAEGLAKRLYALMQRLFSNTGLICSFTGSQGDFDAFWEAAGPLGLSPDRQPGSLEIPEPHVLNEAFIVPTDICFAAKGFDRRLLAIPYSGIWQVASSILSLDYLWGELRVKGGAYGAGFKADRGGSLQFYTYRDPNLDTSLACFDRAAQWLSAFDPSEEEMLGYIISTVAGYDAPKKPREIARIQDAEFFSRLEADWREAARNEVLAATPAAIRALAPVFDDIARKDARCVFGSQDILKAAEASFEIVNLLS
ncbi:MAG: insulinase family protein [Eggerthellaceae bacterium]|nr:insulinase family protein [Eggerthellaceae bacterium]